MFDQCVWAVTVWKIFHAKQISNATDPNAWTVFVGMKVDRLTFIINMLSFYIPIQLKLVSIILERLVFLIQSIIILFLNVHEQLLHLLSISTLVKYQLKLQPVHRIIRGQVF